MLSHGALATCSRRSSAHQRRSSIPTFRCASLITHHAGIGSSCAVHRFRRNDPNKLRKSSRGTLYFNVIRGNDEKRTTQRNYEKAKLKCDSTVRCWAFAFREFAILSGFCAEAIPFNSAVTSSPRETPHGLPLAQADEIS